MHHKIGAIRASVRGGEHVDRVRIPLSNVVKYGRIVVGDVAGVDPVNKLVRLNPASKDDEPPPPIPYDVLVGCTGTVNHSAGDLPTSVRTKDEVRAYFKEVSEAIASSRRVLIAGGGPTAVEFAGEIRDAYPDTDVTIVCSSAGLLSSCVAQPSASFLKALYATLAQRRIELIRGDKVVSPSPSDFAAGRKFIRGPLTVKTSNGLAREFDLVLWAATWTCASSCYPDDWLNTIGELSVDATFRVDGDESGTAFAFGDVCSLSETKQAITLEGKIPVIKRNVLAVADGLRRGVDVADPAFVKSKLRRYEVADKPVLYLPVGERDGVSQVRGWVYGARATAKAKGVDLYTTKFWKALTGHPPPPVTNVALVKSVGSSASSGAGAGAKSTDSVVVAVGGGA